MRTDILNNRKRRPTHPGEILREEVLSSLELNQGRLAELLDVSRQTINEIVTEKRSVSMDMAYRLGRLFNMDPTTWISNAGISRCMGYVRSESRGVRKDPSDYEITVKASARNP